MIHRKAYLRSLVWFLESHFMSMNRTGSKLFTSSTKISLVSRKVLSTQMHDDGLFWNLLIILIRSYWQDTLKNLTVTSVYRDNCDQFGYFPQRFRNFSFIWSFVCKKFIESLIKYFFFYSPTRLVSFSRVGIILFFKTSPHFYLHFYEQSTHRKVTNFRSRN